MQEPYVAIVFTTGHPPLGFEDKDYHPVIPKKIHYCWFGRGPMPELAQQCIASWHRFMPDWEYILWDEDRFDVNSIPYTAQAYAAGKYAFVSDYVRLFALMLEGGLYLDTDVEVFRPFDDLLHFFAFAGFEGSKHLPLGTCVLASEAQGQWIREMLDSYHGRPFILKDDSMDLTTNVQFLSGIMRERGFLQNGREQEYKDLHIFPVEYFCPRQTTGEFFKTNNTYCDHLGLGSWNRHDKGWKGKIVQLIGPKASIRLIKLKRLLFA